jgi:hypothetical protein
VVEDLSVKLEASEADRAARLAVIEHQGRQLEAVGQDRARYKKTLEDFAFSSTGRMLRLLGVRLAGPSNRPALELPWLQRDPTFVGVLAARI